MTAEVLSLVFFLAFWYGSLFFPASRLRDFTGNVTSVRTVNHREDLAAHCQWLVLAAGEVDES